MTKCEEILCCQLSGLLFFLSSVLSHWIFTTATGMNHFHLFWGRSIFCMLMVLFMLFLPMLLQVWLPWGITGKCVLCSNSSVYHLFWSDFCHPKQCVSVAIRWEVFVVCDQDLIQEHLLTIHVMLLQSFSNLSNTYSFCPSWGSRTRNKLAYASNMKLQVAVVRILTDHKATVWVHKFLNDVTIE